MPLPTSSRLMLSDIAAEFGIPTPCKLSDFYGTAGLPASGPLKISAFYGLAAEPAYFLSEQAKLFASDAYAGDYLGISCAISGDGSTVVIGAHAEDPDGVPNAGAAYIFTRQGDVWTELAKLTASDKASGDLLGRSCAISGDGSTVVIGAHAEDPDGVSEAGAAYVFTRQGEVWTEQAKLSASDRAYGDYLGISCAISGDGNTVVVGAYMEDPDGVSEAGAAYVFTRQGEVWTEQAKLTAGDKAYGDYLGRACAISGDGNTVVVGADSQGPDGVFWAGSAYIFTRQGDVWTELAKLTASDKAYSDSLGRSCAISGDGSTVVIGAHAEDPDGVYNAGAAYVFTRQGEVWTEQAKLSVSDRAIDDNLGISCAISGDGSTVIVGAHRGDADGVSNAGSAYIFTRQGEVWTEQSKLTASDRASNDCFGFTCAISGSGGVAIVGAYKATVEGVVGAGTAYLFQLGEKG